MVLSVSRLLIIYKNSIIVASEHEIGGVLKVTEGARTGQFTKDTKVRD